MDSTKTSNKKMLARLQDDIDGEVLTDDVTRMCYASDASIYESLPVAVVRPKHNNDCKNIIAFSKQEHVPLIFRGAGTSLAGQCVGSGMVVDVSRYMNKVLDISIEHKQATVQPGVILSELNKQLAPFNLMFAPKPSTYNRCNLGGMIANNAWGVHCPKYGTTRTNLGGLTILMADAEEITLTELDHNALAQKINSDTHEGALYKSILGLIKDNREKIIAAYPDQVPCNNGYPLHELAQQTYWSEPSGLLNIARLISGSEGSLALITSAQLNLVSIPKARSMICIEFANLYDALSAVELANECSAAAVELLDSYLLALIEAHPGFAQYEKPWTINRRTNGPTHRRAKVGNENSVLIIEFLGEDINTLNQHAQAMEAMLKNSGIEHSIKYIDENNIDKIWDIRRATLGLLMGDIKNDKAETFIEDCAVPVNVLARFVESVQDIMRKQGVSCVYYGSVSMGLIHLRPKLNLASQDGRQLFIRIRDEVSQLVVSLHGSISAKHGDGRVRAHHLQTQLGDDVLGLCHQVKQIFDPDNLFNPGIIFEDTTREIKLRKQVDMLHNPSPSAYRWPQSGGLNSAIQQCNGAGACVKHSGSGTMCPTYMASLDESMSTRGRANVLRQMMKRDVNTMASSKQVQSVLQHCLACKACKSECPSQVDMARLKSEVLYQSYIEGGIPWRIKLFARLPVILKYSQPLATLINTIACLSPLKYLLGIHPDRRLPIIQSKGLYQQIMHRPISAVDKTSSAKPIPKGKVVVLNDMLNEFYQGKMAQQLIDILTRLGYEVIISPDFDSIRLLISFGLLDIAKKSLHNKINFLFSYAKSDIPIIGIEPSELLTWRDEAIALCKTEEINKVEKISNMAELVDEFLLKQDLGKLLKPIGFSKALIHVHCHQKSLANVNTTFDLLNMIPDLQLENISSACCGMAGWFGYDRKNYKLSQAVGEMTLFPKIRSSHSDTCIVASGFSCRHQIEAACEREVKHPLQLIYQSMF